MTSKFRWLLYLAWDGNWSIPGTAPGALGVGLMLVHVPPAQLPLALHLQSPARPSGRLLCSSMKEAGRTRVYDPSRSRNRRNAGVWASGRKKKKYTAFFLEIAILEDSHGPGFDFGE